MARPVAHLANLDLNLLVALRELLRERSVTRAASVTPAFRADYASTTAVQLPAASPT